MLLVVRERAQRLHSLNRLERRGGHGTGADVSAESELRGRAKCMRLTIDARGAVLYRGTGIGTYTYQLIKNLCNTNHGLDTTLLWDDTTIPADRLAGASRVVARGPAQMLDEKSVIEALRADGADIYHVPQNGIGLPVERVCRYVISLHDIIPIRCTDGVSHKYVNLFTETVPRAAERADAIITISEYSKADICSAFNLPPHKVHVTHLAAEDFYRPIDRRDASEFMRRKYGIEGDFILYVGGINHRKNVATLIRAYEVARRRSSRPIGLVIAGPKNAHCAELEALSSRLGLADLVAFPGLIPVTEMPYLYNAATVFAYLSLYEGFGLPPLEAMACGIPTVTSNRTCLPEIVADASLCVDPLDDAKIAEAICALLEDPRLYNELVAKGFRRAANFSWQATAAETVKVYASICSGERATG
jgi:glycosyltransferase involved in cell wall biosynthesis